MKFMNSNYGYADFAGRGKTTRRSGSAGSTNSGVPKNSGSAPSKFTPNKQIQVNSKDVVPSVNKPKNQSKVLANTFAKPELREPGIARSARSSAAGASQGSRNLFGTQGKNGVKAKSTIAGLQQKGRDVAYSGGQMLKNAGKFAKNNKVGVGLAAAGALGAVGYGAYRKMRSDKGKKRGSNNN